MDPKNPPGAAITLRTGCSTRPAENDFRASSMVSIKSGMGRTARTSASLNQIGICHSVWHRDWKYGARRPSEFGTLSCVRRSVNTARTSACATGESQHFRMLRLRVQPPLTHPLRILGRAVEDLRGFEWFEFSG